MSADIPQYQQENWPQIHYKGLTFVQHEHSLIKQNSARREGRPVPPARFAFPGGAILSEHQCRARVDYWIETGAYENNPFRKAA